VALSLSRRWLAFGPSVRIDFGPQYLGRLFGPPIKNETQCTYPSLVETVQGMPVRWRQHWVPGTPFINNCDSVRIYCEQCVAPAPPLGHEPPEALPLRDPLRGPCVISSEEINPDFAVAPTGEPQILRFDGNFYVYNGGGALVGILPPERLLTLHQRWAQYSRSGDDLDTKDFEQEVLLLLERHRQDLKTGTGDPLPIKSTWAVPTEIMTALRRLTHFSHELFASPLTVDPGSAAFCSASQRDAVFGAQDNAYAFAWHGSVLLRPDYTPAAMLKAVDHALATALDSPRPVLVVGLLPCWPSHPHFQRISAHPLCHSLASIPKGGFNFTENVYFPGKSKLGARHNHWDLQVVLIANQPGLDTYYNRQADAADAFQATVVSHWRELNPQTSEVALRAKLNFKEPPSTLPSSHPYEARRLQGVRVARNRLPALRPPTPGTRESPPFPYPCHAAGSLPLRFDPNDFVYTDASRAPPADAPLGCGIFNPSSTVAPETNFATVGTVLRGELLAIWWALAKANTADPIHILTDSLNSIFLIHRAVYRPATVRDHAHVVLLNAIASIIRLRTGPTRINKVRAHIGVRGNTKADTLAKQAADNPDSPATREYEGFVPAEIEAESQARVGDDEERPTTWLSAQSKVTSTLLSRSLDKATTTTGKLFANTAGPSLDRVNVPASNSYLAARAVPPQAKKFTKRVRYRCSPCGLQSYLLDSKNKKLAPHDKTPDANCPLCNSIISNWRPPPAVARRHTPLQPPAQDSADPDQGPPRPRVDTWTHTFGHGCLHPSIRRLVNLYHDKAVELIAQTLARRGANGGWAMLADAPGRRRQRVNTVPLELLPQARRNGLKVRPDIMLFNGWPAQHFEQDNRSYPSPTSSPQVQLIPLEFSFANDHYIQERISEKQTKYTALFQLLRAENWTVLGLDSTGAVSTSGCNIATIVVGHSGVVLNDTKTLFMDLGLPARDAQTLCNKLNHLSALKVHVILREKLRLERNLRKRRAATTNNVASSGPSRRSAEPPDPTPPLPTPLTTAPTAPSRASLLMLAADNRRSSNLLLGAALSAARPLSPPPNPTSPRRTTTSAATRPPPDLRRSERLRKRPRLYLDHG